MPNAGSDMVAKISEALKEACSTVVKLSGRPVNQLTRDIIAKRIMMCIEAGEDDPAKWRDFALGGFADRRESRAAA